MSGAADRLRAAAAEIWEAQHRHPFVAGIGDGSLDLDRFRIWVRQDYLFLVEYGRMLSFAAARSPDLETARRFAQLARATFEDEMNLHRAYCDELGIGAAELEGEQMLPTTRGYTDFLVRAAATGDFAELVAALLPCMWGYSEIGLRLAERGRPDHEHYARWIDTYASPEFAELASWCRDLADRIGAAADAVGWAEMERAFLLSSRYELAFWEMAWSRERWTA